MPSKNLNGLAFQHGRSLVQTRPRPDPLSRELIVIAICHQSFGEQRYRRVNPTLRRSFALALVCCMVNGAGAQFRGRGEPLFDRRNIPEWRLEPQFERDCFTFVRIKYRSTRDRSSYAWWTDYPHADLNFSWRLHQMTSMKVDPNGKVIELLDKELFRYPFIFMSGVPAIVLDDDEVRTLRRYLLSGGFLMVDDFWGEAHWQHFEDEVLKRVFPDRAPVELPLEHPLFHCVFDLKEKPQIPNVYHAMRNRGSGVTWEVPDGQTPHYRGISDDKGRLVMLICHNTDLGDGWEEEGRDPYYFAEFSEPKAYPLGINIIVYVLTH